MDRDPTHAAEFRDVAARLDEIGLLADPELLAETVELFVTDAAAIVTQLQDAFASGNALALERAAHRLKGAALNLGVASMAQPARDLEDEARRQIFVDAPARIRAIERELGRVAVFLRAEVAQASARG